MSVLFERGVVSERFEGMMCRGLQRQVGSNLDAQYRNGQETNRQGREAVSVV